MMRVKTIIVAVMMCLGIAFTAQSEPYAGNPNIVPNQTWIDSNTEQRLEMVRDANVALQMALRELATVVDAQGRYILQLEEVLEYLMIIEHGDPKEEEKEPMKKDKS